MVRFAHSSQRSNVPPSGQADCLGVRIGWGIFLACWAAAAVVALAFGRDANPDLRNYHYYNPFALLEARWDLDLAAAGPHSFLHPGLDLPFYLLTQGPLNAWPRVIATVQAGYAGLLAFLVLAVANLVCHGTWRRATVSSALVALFGLTGVATLPEVGATQNDIPIACLVVGALLMLLAPGAPCTGGPGRAGRRHLLAGAAGGAAVGLKLTAVIYPPALAAAAFLAAPGGLTVRLRATALLGLGGVLGFAAIYGPWGWFLWRRFGNPFGPFFNDIFRSPWFPPSNLRDLNFLPESWAEALIYPLLWAHRSEWVVMEPPMADPRFAIGLSALLLAATVAAWRARRHRRAARVGPAGPDPGAAVARRSERTVIAFLLVAYVAWLGAFSILRYASAIEVLLGVPVWAAGRRLLLAGRDDDAPEGGGPAAWWRRGATLCVGAVLGVSVLVTEYPMHPREPFASDREPRDAAIGAVAPIALPDGALVVLVGINVSFVAPFLASPGVRFVGATGWTASGLARGWTSEMGLASHRLTMEALRLIRSHPGPVFVLLESPDQAEDGPRLDVDVVRVFEITFDRASCRPVANNLTPLVQLCRSR